MAPARILALNPSDLNAELAKLVIESQNEALAAKNFFDIGISGGSQAPTLAAALLDNPAVRWAQWRVWLVDERIVPLDHADSNWALFKQHILDKLPASAHPQGFPISEELLAKREHSTVSHDAFAVDYERRLTEVLGAQPSLDLALLGMGPDGHTCSLFPHHALLNESKRLVASLGDSPKPPPERITLTKPALHLANLIVFFAAGAAKKDAIHQIFTEEDPSVPTKQVIDVARNPVVFLTDPAALGH